jgi:hypothetical protein
MREDEVWRFERRKLKVLMLMEVGTYPDIKIFSPMA